MTAAPGNLWNGHPIPVEPSLEALAEMLRQQPACWIAFAALGRRGDRASLELLVAETRSDDQFHRRSAVTAIGSHGLGSEALAVVRQLLSDPSPFVLRAAVAAARQLGDMDSHDGIVVLLANPDPSTRTAALHALASLWRQEDFDRVLEVAKHDSAKQVRRKASWALRQNPDDATWRQLAKYWVTSELPRERAWSCELVGGFGTMADAPLASICANDPDGHVRKAAERAVLAVRSSQLASPLVARRGSSPEAFAAPSGRRTNPAPHHAAEATLAHPVPDREDRARMADWIAKWMSIKPGTRLWLSDPSLVGLLGELPVGIQETADPTRADVVVLFVRDEDDLRRSLGSALAGLRSASSPWVVYRKKEWPDKWGEWVKPTLAAKGLRNISTLPLDHDWVALRFVQDESAAVPRDTTPEDDGLDPARVKEVIRILRGFAAEPKLPLSVDQWPEELAEDLDLYCGVVRWRPIVTDEVVALMNEIDEQTSEMSGEEHAELWTDEAFVAHPLWAVVREKARKALRLLGVEQAEVDDRSGRDLSS